MKMIKIYAVFMLKTALVSIFQLKRNNMRLYSNLFYKFIYEKNESFVVIDCKCVSVQANLLLSPYWSHMISQWKYYFFYKRNNINAFFILVIKKHEKSLIKIVSKIFFLQLILYGNYNIFCWLTFYKI